MTKINDGGPAFPFISWRSPDGMIGMNATEGMSLRDHFAGQAMAALIQSTEPRAMGLTYEDEEFMRVTAQSAYEYADALLAERSKSQEQEP